MMSEAQIRNAIAARLIAVDGQCNSGLIDHTDGVLRGLIWALVGKDPGTYITRDMPRLFRLAGIPFERSEDRYKFKGRFRSAPIKSSTPREETPHGTPFKR